MSVSYDSPVPPVTRYAERSPSRRAWLVLLVLAAVAWAAMVLGADGNLAPATIITLMIGGIAALTMWSVGFYGNVTLTADELRAGRARVRLQDVQPWGVSQEGETPGGRLLGGAFASSLDRATLGLTLRSGEQVRVQTRDPAALRAALESALEPFRTGPAR